MTRNPRDAMERRPHVVVVNQWKEHYADYARYLNHTTHRVTYITTPVGRGCVPPAAAEVALVESTGDLAEVRTALDGLVRRHGPVRRIVALKEGDLLVAAQLRADRGLPGPRPADLLAFRDKYVMCTAVADAGLPVPVFTAAGDHDSVRAFAELAGWPLVVKPRVGGSSDGVVVLAGPGDLARLPDFTEPMLVQAFNPHPIYHVDGVFDGRAPTCLRASRYINSCLGFRDGTFLGSVEEDDPRIVRAIETSATAFLGALTGAPTPFHLELFVERRGEDVTCTFLEVGARVGGAEIPFLWRELHGYDLMRAAFDLQATGTTGTAPPPRAASGPVGGWLLVPAPTARPCLITEATSMVGRRPGPYAEALLSPGEVLPAADAYYEHVGGRFRFRGTSSAEVERALAATATRFRVSAAPVPPAEQAAPVPPAEQPAYRIPEVTR
ncbi:biotin carboxylase [Streptomyces sp. NBC_00237]|uniref:ATP-grasp domain-containing protein n=1 Tax=Streptomyces sp. NBC_00237 TaxID=2975687 RepID=UPI0022544AB1|nr:biotin carboxylase [Streptomyces sp. NBC_00237]MCX5206805.1 biotin carboxylase [Streptomyces sp. NBC_00237]